MKILRDNYMKSNTNIKKDISPYPKKLICDNCSSELEYEKSDVRIGEFGCALVDCPLCKKSICVDNKEDGLILTVDNVEFPIHFHHTSTATGAVECCSNDMIKREIKKGIEFLRTSTSVLTSMIVMKIMW